MTKGFIYCFSNPAMPGILKIGRTERTPEDRAKELFTTGVPLPFKIEFAKYVNDPKDKEAYLHLLLDKYTYCPNICREFFRVSPEEVLMFFNLMDGEMWCESHKNTSSESEPQVNPNIKDCRLAKWFKNEQRIRHTTSCNNTWIGTYDSKKNVIIHDGKFYTSLSNFALLHNRVYNPSRFSTDGWTHCECEVDGKWISCSQIRLQAKAI
jgi:hypothetical protein